MIKNLTSLEHKIGEKLFQLIVEPSSTLGELHDALTVMKGFIIDKIQEAEKNSSPPPVVPVVQPEVITDVAQ